MWFLRIPTRIWLAQGMDLDWCKAPDAGMPVPDLLIHLELGQHEAEARGGFGDERYEVSEFQAQVKSKFKQLYASLEHVQPHIVDVTGLSIDDLGTRILSMATTAWVNVWNERQFLQKAR
eukprot:m.477539 g.477539  ORF g.477539 m.477539 type:complete len:120 (+) comp21688_c1_seq13:759-1118(+)